MANKKITDATQISTMSGSDKLFVNSGDDLKQITLDQAVAASTPVQQLNNNLETYTFMKNIYLKLIQPQEAVSLSIDIQKDGFYILEFIICPCNASASDVGAFWTVECPTSPFDIETSKNRINIPVSKAWDNANVVTFIKQMKAQEYTFIFTSEMSNGTSIDYNTTVRIQGIRLPIIN